MHNQTPGQMARRRVQAEAVFEAPTELSNPRVHVHFRDERVFIVSLHHLHPRPNDCIVSMGGEKCLITRRGHRMKYLPTPYQWHFLKSGQGFSERRS